MQVIQVNLDEREYPVYIGKHLFDQPLLLAHIKGSQVLIVTQSNVAKYYLKTIQNLLSEYQHDVVYISDGEQYKTISEWEKIFDVLLKYGHDRSTTLIALGGGIVGDITGFAAACYQRGVHYIQLPTTLIAQVDSSVGGKTGVNHPLGKNMIGAFYQPQCVIADINTLKTLPERELTAGMAEVLKYGLIRDAEFFVWLEKNGSLFHKKEEKFFEYIVYKSISIKADIVAKDEKDVGIRNILNFGHTFGHAIESLSHYQSILHGEAIAIGMLMAIELSMQYNFISVDIRDRIFNVFEVFGLVQQVAIPDADKMIQAMKQDKKSQNKKLNLILLKSLGEACRIDDISELDIKLAINKVRKQVT